MKTILVALDLQQDADRVLARAALLSRQHRATVTVLHVIEGMDAAGPGLRDEAGRHARAALEAVLGAAPFDGAPTVSIRFGVPHRCVTSAARELSADIILIGPGRPLTASRRVFGSTADRILRTAPVPVLLVRGRPAGRYRDVAAATDFSALSKAALEAARRLAPDARMTLVHAYEMPLPFRQAMLRAGTRSEDVEQFLRSSMDECRRQLQELAQQEGCGGNVTVLHGAPAAVLVRLSRSRRTELIAMGTQGRNAVAEALLGSVAKRVLSEAACDILAVAPMRG